MNHQRLIFFGILITALTQQCDQDEPDFRSVVETGTVSDLTFYGAAVDGRVVDDKGHTIITQGVCWSSKVDDPILSEDRRVETVSIMGKFTAHIKGLTPGTRYFVRAYAISDAGVSFGEPAEFTTRANPFPGRWTVVSRSQVGCDVRDNILMMPDGLPNGTSDACCITMDFTGTTIDMFGFNAETGRYTYSFLTGNENFCFDGKCLTYVQLKYCTRSMTCQTRSYFAFDDGKLLQWLVPPGFPNGGSCSTVFTYKKL